MFKLKGWPFKVNGLAFRSALLLLVLVVVYFFYSKGQARQAAFNVDALQRYITAHKVITGQPLTSLSELPDFYLVDQGRSLSVHSRDIRKILFRGYVYDMRYLGEDRYVISASPAGFLNPGVEFGITDDGYLRFNDHLVDPLADDYEEVLAWQKMSRSNGLRSAQVSRQER